MFENWLKQDRTTTADEITLNGVHPLSTAPQKQPLTVIKVAAGKRATHRLTEMGLTPGVEVKIVQDNGGPILLAVRGSRLAIGQCLAHKVLVSSN
jgi:ferrous iron transport protein A